MPRAVLHRQQYLPRCFAYPGHFVLGHQPSDAALALRMPPAGTPPNTSESPRRFYCSQSISTARPPPGSWLWLAWVCWQPREIQTAPVGTAASNRVERAAFIPELVRSPFLRDSPLL